ncbi:MAG: nuclear transport factor 2 family protein [Aeromicrobium erythreum]
MSADVLTAHRAFYDAVETGDPDLMASLWVDDPGTSCVHPGAEVLHGTSAVLRSWSLLMANLDYIQFFLTDVRVTHPWGADGDVAVVSCTENILSGQEMADDSFAGGKAVCTSLLVRRGGSWRFFARHASPVIEMTREDDA